ncbi:MAG: phage minor head protein [Candidatus Odinarchaeota archaeon]
MKKTSVEIGTTGLNRWGGNVQEEFLSELRGQRGRRIYLEMSSNDPVVGAILFAVEMALREVPWYVEPGSDSKTTEFLKTCMDDCSHTWADFISEVLHMLTYGFSWFEIVYKKRDGINSKYSDGLIGWRKFAHRPADTLSRWEFDENGGISAFVQSCPPDFREVRIPVGKSILFRTRKEKNNPEGRSILRTAYRPWYFKKNLEALEGISLERIYAGFPVIKLPKGASTGSGGNSDESRAKDLVRKVRVDEQMGIVLPDGWEFDLMGPKGSRDLSAYGEAIGRYRQEIMISVMASFIALGIEKAGSYALAREIRDFFQVSLMGWLDNIRETINLYAVPKLMRLNGLPTEDMPKIACGQVGKIDLEIMGNYIKNLVEAGALMPDTSLEDYLRQAADLPPREQSPEAVGKAEDFHPNIKRNRVRALREIEGGVERQVRGFFRKQKPWILNNWQQFLPEGVFKAETWEEWDQEFARDTEKPISDALKEGAESAMEDTPGINFEWNVENKEAQRFIRENGLKLAKGVNKTTQARLRDVLATGVSFGEDREQLTRRVLQVLKEAETWRARRIAQTEVIRAYNQGSLQVFREGNYRTKEWMDGQAGACPECSDLDGVVVGINEQFPGGYDAPPAHPGCRCTIEASR